MEKSHFSRLQMFESKCLNVPKALKPLCLIHPLGESPFLIFSLWGNKELDLPSMQDGKFQNKIGSNGQLGMPHVKPFFLIFNLGPLGGNTELALASMKVRS